MNYFVLIVIYIIILLWTAHFVYQAHRNIAFKNMIPANVIPKTGDVILVSSDSIYDNMHLLFYVFGEIWQKELTGSFYTHAGIIVELNDDIYVYHMIANPTYDDYRGMYVSYEPILQRFDKYVKLYPGYVTLYTAPDLVDITNKLSNPYKYSINLLNWIVDLNLKTTYFTRQDELYCYELVAYMLDMDYSNISAQELECELYKRGYNGPYLIENFYSMKYAT